MRRAAYRAVLARELLDGCPAGATPANEAVRYEELKRLAVRTGAGHALWLGENDAAAVRRVAPGGRCGPGEAPRRAAVMGYSRSLDALAGRIAEYRP